MRHAVAFPIRSGHSKSLKFQTVGWNAIEAGGQIADNGENHELEAEGPGSIRALNYAQFYGPELLGPEVHNPLSQRSCGAGPESSRQGALVLTAVYRTRRSPSEGSSVL